MSKRISILGSTGSIGCSALDVIRRHPDRFRVAAIAAHSNTVLLARQAAEFHPECIAVTDEEAAQRLSSLVSGPKIIAGPGALEEAAGVNADTVLCAVVGAVGLKPILRAIDEGRRVAIANKEPLVMAGPLIMDRARRRGVDVLPVDSEHNAIFQCLMGHPIEHVACIHITASGGPFYGRDRNSLKNVTPEEAASHPRWDMGTKISVDSATLMNKGLEVIEAMWLFGLPVDRIHVVIHPQSTVHGLVEFTDGSILAHLGPTDMRFPIEFALTWPERVDSAISRLNLAAMGTLEFAAPDFSEFPCLAHALRAARTGGTATAALNAANEMAVQAFCNHEIPFLEIASVVEHAMNTCPISETVTLDSALATDAEARRIASARIQALGASSS